MSRVEHVERVETLGEVLADMRREAAKWHPETMMHNWLVSYADRIEAAWKRERAEIEADALSVGGVVEASRKREMSKIASKNGADFGQLGDAAALREVVTALAAVILPPRDKAGDGGWLAWVRAMQGKARAALAKPPRNCDVGTAEERAQRLNEWCSGRHCVNCQFKGGWPDECKLRWAQMPYEEEGGAK